ncbi:MAG: HAD family phosphatase [Candidatus Jordarchaeaceae archaeon]
MREYRLVAFDMDGTVISGLDSWRKLHEYFGVENQLNFREYLEKKIDYAEFMRRDITLWQPPPHIDEVKKVLLDYEFQPHAKQVMKELKELGLKVSIISAGIDIRAKDVGSRLGIKCTLANGLKVDSKGFLVGEGILRVDLLKKEKALEKVANRFGFELEECIAVGDSKFDKSFLSAAGLGIAYKPAEELKQNADLVIEDLREILKIFKK